MLCVFLFLVFAHTKIIPPLSRALKVRDPYATMLVDGSNDYEIRGQTLRKNMQNIPIYILTCCGLKKERGVVGVVVFDECLNSSQEQLDAHNSFHGTDKEMGRKYAQTIFGINAWHVANCSKFDRKVFVEESNGQQFTTILRIKSKVFLPGTAVETPVGGVSD